ncbi:MAG: hypothetical protein ABI581_02520, partial [Sediminibacterium sp.]
FEKQIKGSDRVVFPYPYNIPYDNPFFGKGNVTSGVQVSSDPPQDGDCYYVETGDYRIYYIYHASGSKWTILHVQDMQPDLAAGGGSPIIYPTTGGLYTGPLPGGFDVGGGSGSNPSNTYNPTIQYPPNWVSQDPNGSIFAPGENQELPPDPNYIPPGLSANDAWDYIQLGLKVDPLGLLNLSNIPTSLKEEWIALTKFSPDAVSLNRLTTIFKSTSYTWSFGMPVITIKDVAYVEKIANGNGVVNLDYYPVTVTQLPTINGRQLTPEETLDHIRKNINSFVNNTITEFYPYNYQSIDDNALWNSNNPNSAIVELIIPGDKGSVITSYETSKPNKWTFTTIHDPKNGDHPVSGNREFGVTTNPDGSYTFYTKAADRVTSLLGSVINSGTTLQFLMAEGLWRSFQIGIKTWIDSNSGSSSIQEPTIVNPNWQTIKGVINGSLPLSELRN